MTDMQNMNAQLSEKERQQKVYEAAMASLHRAEDARIRAGAQVIGLYGPGDNMPHSETRMAKAADVANKFLILFACLAPSLLLWHTML